MSSKPDLLYISPVIPAVTGNGLAMRAGVVLEALAEYYDISLLVVRLYAGHEASLPQALKRLCRRTAIVPYSIAGRQKFSFLSHLVPYGLGSVARYQRLRFDVVHVFRLAMVPFVDPFLERRRIRPELHLDLDDIESATHRRLAELRRANGDHAKALIEDAQARQSEAAEAAAFRKFDLVYVCSETDRARLAARTNVEICVLPNAVRIPGAGQHTGEEGTFRFLFVGTLGYYANEDAALQLCQEIVPRLRQASPCDFAVDIVGGGASDRIREAARAARVNLLGWVQDIETYYRGAHAMVVPLRAGGGTRIKILEAFGYRLPVVSTSSGSEGIDARDEQEILLADTPEAFVHACARLMGDPELRKCLTMNAFNLVLHSYSLDGTRGIIGAVRGRRGRHSCSAVT